jgi:hypothetical protein
VSPSPLRRSARHKPRRRWVRSVVFGLGGAITLIGVIAAVAIVHLVVIGARLSHVEPTLQAAETDVRDGRLADAQAKLATTERTVRSANDAIHLSLDFRILSVLPVASQNFHAIKQSVTLAFQLVAGGQRILAAAAPLKGADGHLVVPLSAGNVPVQAIGAVAQAVAETASNLPGPLERPHSHLLIGRVRALQTKVFNEAVKRRAEFGSVATALRLIDEMSGANGDRRYLLAVANTAEMRGSGGMILSYGVLTGSRGHVTLDRFGPIDELLLAAPAPAPLPDDFRSRFGRLAPTQLWRNANFASDFTVVGPVLESMFNQATGERADGVIQIDPGGLAAILQGTGPINIPDLGQVTAANVVDVTLNQAYTRFPDRPVRQEYTAAVAKEAFRRLVAGQFPSLRPLGEALVKAAATRHVIMHARSAAVETDLAALGADGSLPGPGVEFTQLTVQNFTGNKLDYYLDTALHVTGSLPTGKVGHLHVVIDITNTAPVGGRPPYVFGPYNNSFKPGEYLGLVTLYLPSGSVLSRASHDGTTDTPTWQTEAGRTAITYFVTLGPGGRSQVVLDVDLPPKAAGSSPIVAIPTPRVRPTAVTLSVTP